MKRVKSYTFIMASNSSSVFKRATVGKNSLLVFVGLLLVFLFSFVFLLTAYFSISVDKWALSRLKRENRDLRASLSSSSRKLEDLEKRVYKINDFSRKLQLIANVPSSQFNDRLGWGGAYSPAESLLALSEPHHSPWGKGGKRRKKGKMGKNKEFLGFERRAPSSAPVSAFAPSQPPLQTLVGKEELELRVEKLSRKSELAEEDIWTLYSNLLTQKEILDRTPSRQPVLDGWLSSGFGYRDETFYSDHEPDFHRGVDFAAMEGSVVIATADGKAVYTGYDDEGFGNLIILDHGYGVRTYYAHLAEIYVRAGQNIKKGEKIASVGSTGKSTGPHLHYEVRIFGVPVNPENYILDRPYFHLSAQ